MDPPLSPSVLWESFKLKMPFLCAKGMRDGAGDVGGRCSPGFRHHRAIKCISKLNQAGVPLPFWPPAPAPGCCPPATTPCFLFLVLHPPAAPGNGPSPSAAAWVDAVEGAAVGGLPMGSGLGGSAGTHRAAGGLGLPQRLRSPPLCSSSKHLSPASR